MKIKTSGSMIGPEMKVNTQKSEEFAPKEVWEQNFTPTISHCKDTLRISNPPTERSKI